MTLNEVFEENIKDIHHAEKQLTKALPKMIKKCTNPELKQALEMHLGETEEHVRRLEQCAEILGIKATGKVCHGMMGLVDEATEHMGELKPGPVMDAVIIASGQKAEHYEIAAYGTICEWGKLLGHNDVVKILKMSIAEEEMADQKLTQIAEGTVNRSAMSGGKEAVAKAVVQTSRSNGVKKGATREKAGTTRR
jgi:ferritin-like metal-binding protein YciE